MSLIEQTTRIVESFVVGNQINFEDLPNFIKGIHLTLCEISGKEQNEPDRLATISPDLVTQTTPIATEENFSTELINNKPTPFLSIQEAVTPDLVTCLHCGKSGKTLKRHIIEAHNQTEREYRLAFGVEADFPLVAPNYSQRRRELAIKNRLGEKLQTGKKTRRTKKSSASA
ncbi:MAG: MucR family transcriptional regulator [Magnetococcus sp. DMHC-6]